MKFTITLERCEMSLQITFQDFLKIEISYVPVLLDLYGFQFVQLLCCQASQLHLLPKWKGFNLESFLERKNVYKFLDRFVVLFLYIIQLCDTLQKWWKWSQYSKAVLCILYRRENTIARPVSVAVAGQDAAKLKLF